MRGQFVVATSLVAISVVFLVTPGGTNRTRTNRIVVHSSARTEINSEHLIRNRLRVATFNAKFLPFMPSNKTRANALAQRIRASGYDIIVLNEVFSERARKILVDSVSTHYPHVVEYLGSTHFREDSGLMLFSKFPFDATPTLARFVEFTPCKSSDCLAGKGVGYVRVGINQHPLHIFFTHLQANYSRHDKTQRVQTAHARAKQIEEMARFMAEVLGPHSKGATLVLGDLNVDGAVAGHEWTTMLATLNQSSIVTLLDVWHKHAPKEVAGLTYPAVEPAVSLRLYTIRSN